MWVTSGPGYNVAKIKERMPDAPVDSLRMFYDPAVVAKFEDCGVSILDAPSEVVGTVLIYLGKDPNSESPEDLKAAENVLMAIRPYLRYVHSSRYIEDLANGETCLALGWSGDVKQARDRAKDAGKGIEIGYPFRGRARIMNFDMLAIPADAPHPRQRAAFHQLPARARGRRQELQPRQVRQWQRGLDAAAESMRCATIRTSIRRRSSAAKLVPEPPRSQEYQRLLTRTWTRFKTGK